MCLYMEGVVSYTMGWHHPIVLTFLMPGLLQLTIFHVSSFFNFFPTHLIVVTESTILSPNYPMELCNLHVNSFKNLAHCHLRQHHSLLGSWLGPCTSCALHVLPLLIIKISSRLLQHIHIRMENSNMELSFKFKHSTVWWRIFKGKSHPLP